MKIYDAKRCYVSVPCETYRVEESGAPVRYSANAFGLHGESYASEKAAKFTLGVEIEASLSREKAAREADRPIWIWCEDGSVLVCAWDVECYGYSIARPGESARILSTGHASMQSCVSYAREHASQCFGGVK